MKTARAFTLVEILIVVVILGILAATVITFAAGSTLSAKESAVATELQMLRNYILVYKCQHLEVSPGYPNGNTAASPTEAAFIAQATLASTTAGATAAIGTAGYVRGPYMQMMPINPLNGLRSIQVLGNGEDFSAADHNHGWIYKPATAEIKVNTAGNDSTGKPYYDY